MLQFSLPEEYQKVSLIVAATERHEQEARDDFDSSRVRNSWEVLVYVLTRSDTVELHCLDM